MVKQSPKILTSEENATTARLEYSSACFPYYLEFFGSKFCLPASWNFFFFFFTSLLPT